MEQNIYAYMCKISFILSSSCADTLQWSFFFKWDNWGLQVLIICPQPHSVSVVNLGHLCPVIGINDCSIFGVIYNITQKLQEFVIGAPVSRSCDPWNFVML